jgi:uncharacterized protein YndB with AHSA1/START domain
MTAEPRRDLIVTHPVSASPERVFDAWLDPKDARLFLFATADGEMVRAEIDPRVGGRFTFVDRRPGQGEVEHAGEYLDIDRPRRLVFSFGVPGFSAEMTRVTIAIAADGEGSLVTLTHEGVLADYAERTREGWTRILAGLLPALDGVSAAGWRHKAGGEPTK